MNPQDFAEEYISTEECGKRLGLSDQTIRNWSSIGRKDPSKGWTEGIHYVNVSPDVKRKAVIRVPWNYLVQSFARNEKTDEKNLRGTYNLYKPDKEFLE